MINLNLKYGRKRSVFYNVALFAGLFLLLLGSLLPEPATAHQDHRHDDQHKVAMLIIDPDSYLVNEAVKSLDVPHDIVVQFFTLDDLQNKPQAANFAADAEVVIIDVMGPELVDWVLQHLDSAVHLIYALRGSRDDESLRQQGLIFDDAIKDYFNYLSIANIRNFIYRTAKNYSGFGARGNIKTCSFWCGRMKSQDFVREAYDLTVKQYSRGVDPLKDVPDELRNSAQFKEFIRESARPVVYHSQDG